MRDGRLIGSAGMGWDTGLKTRREKTRLIVAAGVGNFLEIFDFTVYSFFAGVIGQVFFQADDPMVSLMISVSVFGVGFLMRPLGSIVIGAYADRHGRKAAMLVTIALIGVWQRPYRFCAPLCGNWHHRAGTDYRRPSLPGLFGGRGDRRGDYLADGIGFIQAARFFCQLAICRAGAELHVRRCPVFCAV